MEGKSKFTCGIGRSGFLLNAGRLLVMVEWVGGWVNGEGVGGEQVGGLLGEKWVGGWIVERSGWVDIEWKGR